MRAFAEAEGNLTNAAAESFRKAVADGTNSNPLMPILGLSEMLTQSDDASAAVEVYRMAFDLVDSDAANVGFARFWSKFLPVVANVEGMDGVDHETQRGRKIVESANIQTEAVLSCFEAWCDVVLEAQDGRRGSAKWVLDSWAAIWANDLNTFGFDMAVCAAVLKSTYADSPDAEIRVRLDEISAGLSSAEMDRVASILAAAQSGAAKPQ